MRPADWIAPDWPAPATVRALVTTRSGGVSAGPYAGLNLGTHVGDDPALVECNRLLLNAHLPSEPTWLEQVHGTAVADADTAMPCAQADASVARRPRTVCAVLTADCLPVLLCDAAGSVVAAAHAGWRGLAAGVLENTVAAMGGEPGALMAWLGPAIGPQAFEVGSEVREIFVAADGSSAEAFAPGATEGKWLADLYLLARHRLLAAGVSEVYGGGWCTQADATRFYSFRRDGVTGRFASLIWLSDVVGA